jgi:protein-S-isoprenylcysteine O-methyltransferase Ste14
MARIVILIEFVVFLSFVVGFNVKRGLRGREPLGKYPIHPLLFATGKLSMGASLALLALYTVGIDLSLFDAPVAFDYVSAGLFLIGLVFSIAAFLQLGNESRFGVSQETSGLKTTGVYSVSRNPMYLGFYLITLASLLSVPNPVNVCAGSFGIFVHHWIVLAEERFLQKKHGASYEAYRRRVRRYI